MFNKTIIAAALIAVSSVASAKTVELPEGYVVAASATNSVDAPEAFGRVYTIYDEAGNKKSTHIVVGDVTFVDPNGKQLAHIPGVVDTAEEYELAKKGIKALHDAGKLEGQDLDNALIVGDLPQTDMTPPTKVPGTDLNKPVVVPPAVVQPSKPTPTSQALKDVNDRVNTVTDQMNQGFTQVGNKINGLESRMHKMQDDIDVLQDGVAMSFAMSALPKAFHPGSTVVGAGVGNFEGSNAVAVGISHQMEDTPVTVNFNFSSTGTETGAAIGVGYSF